MTLPKQYTDEKGKIRYMKTAGKILVVIGGSLLPIWVLNPTPYNSLALPMLIIGGILWAIYSIKTSRHGFTPEVRHTIYHILNWTGRVIMGIGVILSAIFIIGILTLNPSLFLAVDYYIPFILIGVGFLIRFIGAGFADPSRRNRE